MERDAGKGGKKTRRAFLKSAGAASAYGALGGALGACKPSKGTLPIGMNLAGIADWEPGFPFLNLMWGARVWLTRNVAGDGPWNTEMTAKLELDENGYPLEVPFQPEDADGPQSVFTLLPNVLTAGTYVILYDGVGEIGTAGGTKIVDSKPGRIVISMAHEANVTPEEISILRSVRGDHIRNVRVLPIAHEHADLQTNPFRPEVIAFCRPWHCLRFMDWLGTNNSGNQKWADRKKPTFCTQVGAEGDVLGLLGNATPAWERKWASGVAIELCVKLANLTRTDAWLCVPHLADDDYIAEMAKLVKAQLDPSLKVYVEFSNEIWNWQFQQAHWMLRSELAGDLVSETAAAPPWKHNIKPKQFRDGVVASGAGEGSDHPERIGALFRRCFRIWEEVFSGIDRIRLVRVCTVQADWGDTALRTLTWVMRNGGCDALSPGGYFGPNADTYRRWEAAGARLTAADVIADMRFIIDANRSVIAEMAGYANKAKVPLIIYEGGQHIQPLAQAETPYNPALAAAQTHPKMYDLYRRHLSNYSERGATLFCAFSSVGRKGTRWGSWGHVERYGKGPGAAPKYRAILDANTAR